MTLSMYGKQGETEPTPIAALLAAAAAECEQCYRTQLMAVAANPMLVAHLAACGYLVLKKRAERTGVPVPEVKELAETYVSTTAAMFAAFSLDAFRTRCCSRRTPSRRNCGPRRRRPPRCSWIT